MWRHFLLSAKSGELWRHLKVTLYEQILGFAIGMGGGVAIGLGLWWSRTLSRILEPFAVIFNGIPKIALAPPMIVWFGIYETSKIVLAASICFVVAWLSAYAGARMVDRDLLDMCRAMGGSRWQAFVKVVVPSAMPWIISALKINIGFALIGAVVGEFVASNHGLGYMAVQASILYQMNLLWMVVFVIMTVAAVQYWAVLWLEHRLLGWMGEEGVGVRA
jgi:NitT/TauT family transport system permease protein